MTNLDVLSAAARLLTEFGDVQSAERAAGARIQTACNTSERGFWSDVRRVLAAGEAERGTAEEVQAGEVDGSGGAGGPPRRGVYVRD